MTVLTNLCMVLIGFVGVVFSLACPAAPARDDDAYGLVLFALSLALMVAGVVLHAMYIMARFDRP